MAFPKDKKIDSLKCIVFFKFAPKTVFTKHEKIIKLTNMLFNLDKLIFLIK